ncbi:hypothetical protein Tco_1122612 [Tanacetum coccineum]|uniref:DUF4283 domain-containing protein n=1 Tax=Tanacetum coccineum TaxID=301880 RepID=A0ABQ5J3B7_9ASTR
MSAGVSSGVSTGAPTDEEDRLGEELQKDYLKKDMLNLERQIADRSREKDNRMCLMSAKYYTDARLIDIMGQVHANQLKEEELSSQRPSTCCAGMMLMGDLQYCVESHEGGQFNYKKKLKHTLEIEIDWFRGKDMTYAEKPIRLELIEIWFQFPEFMKVAAFGVHAVNFLMLLQRLSPAIIRFLIQEVWSWFQDVAVQSSGIVTTSRYVVPTGRVKVPAGRYVVPTGKDNVIVSAGRSKVIPAGRTILVLVVLCLLRVDSIVS